MATDPKLTFEDIRDFFEEKAPDAPGCLYCKSRDWTIMYVTETDKPGVVATTYALPIVEPPENDLAVDLTQQIQSIAPVGAGIVPMSCKHCGGMRILDIRPLVVWKLQKLARAMEDALPEGQGSNKDEDQ
jgi:hypothetical protein